MKKLTSYTFVVLLALAALAIAAAPDKEAIKAKETAAWQAFKDKNADAFKKVVDKDFRGIYEEGISNLQKELDDMQKWDMKSFALSDFKVTMVDANTATVTYKAKIEAKMGSEDESGAYNVGSVWSKQNGEWRNIFHTNVKVDDD